jgi:beta-mannosidase
LHTEKQSGDIHYWGVWWGQLPFASYRDRIGRFTSEYGFQSFPEFRTIESFAAPGDYAIDSEVMKAHQRSYIGNGTIVTYMARDYAVPKDFWQFLYVGQVLQAEGIRIAMEAHRVHRPYCMGSLFWQINDCWPVASWSSIDYYGRWKAQQYFARKSFAPELVTSWLDEDTVRVCAVRDRLDGGLVTLTLRVMDFSGAVLKTSATSFMLPANASEMAFTGSAADLLADAAPETVLMHASLADSGTVLAEDLLYFRPVKDLTLPRARPTAMVKDLGSTFAIALSSSMLAKNLYIDVDGIGGVFSDNYFDLLPGMPAVVRFTPTTPASAAAIEASLQMMHMALVE